MRMQGAPTVRQATTVDSLSDAARIFHAKEQTRERLHCCTPSGCPFFELSPPMKPHLLHNVVGFRQNTLMVDIHFVKDKDVDDELVESLM